MFLRGKAIQIPHRTDLKRSPLGTASQNVGDKDLEVPSGRNRRAVLKVLEIRKAWKFSTDSREAEIQ